MTAVMDEKAAAKLRKPFAASAIGKLPKPYSRDSQKGNCPECHGYHGLPAVHLDYVGHAATTDRLLEVDPQWSWEPMAVDELGLPALDRKGNLWIRLTVCGVTRIGVGDGNSAKECIGDAIRNAAMRFGVALDLWAKEDLEQVTVGAEKLRGALSGSVAPVEDVPPGETEPPSPQPDEKPASKPLTARTRGRLFALFGQKGVAEADQLTGANHILGTAYESRSQFTEDDAKTLIAALEKRPDVAEVAS